MSDVTYALHGTTIGVDRPLRLLRGTETDEAPSITISLHSPRRMPAPRHWRVRWSDEDEDSLHEAWDGDVTWLRFRGGFDARCEGTDVAVRVRSDLGTVSRGVIDLVVPMLRVDQGALALHAAGLVGPSGEVTLLLGDNGAGKSTAAAVGAWLGWPVLADDCVVVEHDGASYRACRGVPSIGIAPSTADAVGLAGPARGDEDKLDVPLAGGRLAPRHASLARIVFLGPRDDGTELRSEPVGGTDALVALADQCHAGLRGIGADTLLERLGDLIGSVPVQRARIPQGLDAARAALEASGW